ncbi:hypothetical protein L6R52_18835 [Myxococcota bacterium]|nr:hypothetical protein [Myxococcota bacterium]
MTRVDLPRTSELRARDPMPTAVGSGPAPSGAPDVAAPHDTSAIDHAPSSAADVVRAQATKAAGFFERAIAGLAQRHPVAVAAVLLATLPFGPLASGAPVGDVGAAPRTVITANATAEHAAAEVPLELKTRVDHGARGAYFRKVVSGVSTANRAIRVEGTLPTPSFDPARQYLSPSGADHFKTGPLDRPSVYLGGRGSGHELDAGLTWDRVYDAAGRATWTDRTDAMSSGRDGAHTFVKTGSGADVKLVDGTGRAIAEGRAAVDAKLRDLVPNFGFRPYFRTTNGDGDDWHQPKVGATDNVYFYPGERFAMSIQVTGKNALKMVIRTEDGTTSYSTPIHQRGFGGAKGQSFKRIMSIDQFTVKPNGERTGLEGSDVLPTHTTLKGGAFDRAELTVATKSGTKTVPMRGRSFVEVRGGDTSGRYGSIFHVTGTNARGGERLDITPLRPAPR